MFQSFLNVLCLFNVVCYSIIGNEIALYSKPIESETITESFVDVLNMLVTWVNPFIKIVPTGELVLFNLMIEHENIRLEPEYLGLPDVDDRKIIIYREPTVNLTYWNAKDILKSGKKVDNQNIKIKVFQDKESWDYYLKLSMVFRHLNDYRTSYFNILKRSVNSVLIDFSFIPNTDIDQIHKTVIYTFDRGNSEFYVMELIYDDFLLNVISGYKDDKMYFLIVKSFKHDTKDRDIMIGLRNNISVYNEDLDIHLLYTEYDIYDGNSYYHRDMLNYFLINAENSI